MAGPGTAPSAPLPRRPHLRPWYRVVEDGDRVLLEYAQSVVVLEGRSVSSLLRALLPLLDGTRTVDDIAAVLGSAVRPAIDHALAVLSGSRLLDEGPPAPDDLPGDERQTAELLAALSQGACTVAAAARAVSDARVAVAGESAVGAEVSRLLIAAGCRRLEPADWDDPAGDVDLVVACPGGHQLPRLEDWNAALLRSRTPWLQVLPFDGRILAIGPLFLPGDSCCWRCYQLRRSAVSSYRTEFAALECAPAPFPSPRGVAAIAAGTAALLALRWLAWRDPLVPGRLFAVELDAGVAARAHHVYRVPRCPACSRLDGVAPPLPWFKEEPVAAR
jgi:bacteriocin biosynthesis cyclodehydratase domain-containing protein